MRAPTRALSCYTFRTYTFWHRKSLYNEYNVYYRGEAIPMQRGSKCIYQRLDNGIQEFAFQVSTHAAVDEFIDHLNWIVANEPTYKTDTITRLLMDTSISGALPMFYIAKSANELTRRQPLALQTRPTRAAQLYSASSAYVSIARNLGKVFTNKNFRQEYFQNDRDAAIAWLLKID